MHLFRNPRPLSNPPIHPEKSFRGRTKIQSPDSPPLQNVGRPSYISEPGYRNNYLYILKFLNSKPKALRFFWHPVCNKEVNSNQKGPA